MSQVDDQKKIGTEVQKTEDQQLADMAAADFKAVKNTGELNMAVKVHSPFKEYFNGSAFSVSAENTTGPFDILPRHHNFISLLMPCELVIRSVSEGEKRIRISGGIMHVKADELIVFLDV